MKKKNYHFIPAFVLFCLSLLYGAENYSEWSYYRDIAVNTTAGGVVIASDQINFPLLIRLNPSDSFVFTTAKANGVDIRFSKVNSPKAHIPFQIEYWDASAKKAAIWVLIDTVKKTNNQPAVRMYWGRDNAIDSSKGSAVFDTAVSRGFQAVWHMNEANGDTILDATLNKFRGIPSDTLSAGFPADTMGIIGRGKNFSSSNNYSGSYYWILNSAAGKLNFDTMSAYSISVWVNIDSMGTSRHFISKSLNYQYNLYSRPNGNLAFTETRGGAIRKFVQNNDSVNGGKTHQWRHVVAVHKGQPTAAMFLYVDGEFASNSLVSSSAYTRNTLYNVMLGRRPDLSGEFFKGTMDEVRIENTVRSADWIKLCYETQKDDSCVSMGACSIMPPASVAYPADSFSLKTDSAITAISPTAIGKVDSFTITPLSASGLPPGLSFNSSDGSITGTPTAAVASAKFIIAAINAGGAAKDTISISVHAPVIAPTITMQSGNQWYRVKSANAKVWVQASGTAPLTYSWKRNGVSIPTANKDTLRLDTIRREDDSAVFICSVTNSAGSVTSAACPLRVVAAIFGVTREGGADTLTVGFFDSTTGSSAAFPISRTWFFGDGDSSKDDAPVHFYSKPGTYTAKLVAVVNSIVDSTTRTIMVSKSSLHADFKADTLFGLGSLKVVFTDSSKGPIDYRTWFFGDKKIVADTGKHSAVEHTYDSAGSYTVKLVIGGIGGTDTMKKSDYIVIRPVNTIQLKAQPISDSSILLTWKPITAADSIQIAYSSIRSLPSGEEIVKTDYFIKTVPPSAQCDTVRGLKPKVQYFFGARIFYNGLASFFTESSKDSAVVSGVKDSFVGAVNPNIYVTNISFDTAKAAITVHWKISPPMTDSDSMDAGIFWSTLNYRTDSLSTPDTIKKNVKNIDSCIFRFGEELVFDTTYFFTALLRQSGKPWISFSDSAKGLVKIPAFSRQFIKYGNGIDYPFGYADNKRIRISIKPSTDLSVDTNTIEVWKPSASLSGFIPVGEGFKFHADNNSPPLNIGARYVLPHGRPLKSVKMYRFKDDKWLLERSPLEYDSTHGYVVVTTGDISFPFIAMIDTLTPVITVLSQTLKTVPHGKEVVDSFRIVDNIANTSWNFKYAKGGFAFDAEHSDTGIFSSYENTRSSLIPEIFVSADVGVRAIMTVSDGVNDTVVNVSRRVIRDAGSEVVQTDPMKWAPLFVTGELDSPKAKSALAKLTADHGWKYDNTEFRLFRWYSFAGNASNDTNKYVEYTDALDSIFSLVPGRLLWIKTKKAQSIDFGTGVTLDLVNPYVVSLQQGAWTDIALPYKFDIVIGDVLDATKAAGQPVDSLRIGKWSDTTGSYMLKELYFPAMGVSTLQDVSTVFSAQGKDGSRVGYCIYNPSRTVVKLSFPPIPAITSIYALGAGKRTTEKGRGAIAISAKDAMGAISNTVYCGVTDGKSQKRYFPAAPSFGGGIALRACDNRMREFGHLALSEAWNKGAGASCDLAINNTAENGGAITITVCGDNALPEILRFMVFDPSKNSFTEAGEDGVVKAQVNVRSGEVSYCQLIAGSAEYLAKVKLSAMAMKTELVGMYPNPFRQAVRIRFGLPFGFMGKVQFAIFDACGRGVWNSVARGHSGSNDVIWTGINKGGRLTAPGLYILRMTALNASGERLGTFEKKLTYLP